MPRVCVFDVNETMLDLSALDPHFQRIFGDASLRKAWFTQMLQSAFVSTITKSYTDFGAVGMAALEMVAERQKVRLSEEDRQSIRDGMQHLPPYPEVNDALDMLRNAGVRLAALTNSTMKVAEAKLTNAGLINQFEQVLSADTVHRLKPAPEPYHMAAERLGVGIYDVRLVAAHAWDVAGAMLAGSTAAFVARPGMVLDPLFPKPDIIGSDLREVALQIVGREKSS